MISTAVTVISGPAYFGWHGREDRIDVAAGLEPEGRAAVVEQVELDIAAAPDQLFMPVGFGPGGLEIAPHQLRVDAQKGFADRLGKGEVGIPVARIMVVVKDPAGAARFVAVRQEEVLVAPGLVALVIDAGAVVAGSLHGGVEIDGVDIGLDPAAIKHRGEVCAAAEPLLAGDDHARVHVHGRHVRVARVHDQRNAGAPELGTRLGAGHLLGEILGKFAMHGRDMHARLFEHPPMQHAHFPAAASGAVPGGALECARWQIGIGAGNGCFDSLELGADAVAQGPEPQLGHGLFIVDVGGECHDGEK